MRFIRTALVASLCLGGSYAVGQLIYPGVLSWGANTGVAPNGLPALCLDGGVPNIDAGTKWADGGPNCVVVGFQWVDAGGLYLDGGELDGGPFVFDAGYFCDAGMNDAGPGTYWYFGNYYDAGPFSDGGVKCYDTVGDGGPYSDIGPVLADGGPILRIDAGLNLVCDAGAAAYINADGGTILADGGPWMTSQVVNVGDRSSLSVTCVASGADPSPAGNIQIQNSTDGQNWFLAASFAPFDAGVNGVYSWAITSGGNPYPLVRVAVLNANDAGVLQCSMWAKH